MALFIENAAGTCNWAFLTKRDQIKVDLISGMASSVVLEALKNQLTNMLFNNDK